MNIKSIAGVTVGNPTRVTASCRRQAVIPEGTIVWSQKKVFAFIPAGNPDLSTAFNKIPNSTQHEGFELVVSDEARAVIFKIKNDGHQAWVNDHVTDGFFRDDRNSGYTKLS